MTYKVLHIGACELEEIHGYNTDKVDDVLYVEGSIVLYRTKCLPRMQIFNDKYNRNFKVVNELIWNETGIIKTLKGFNNKSFGSIMNINKDEWIWPDIKDKGYYDEENLTTITLNDLFIKYNIKDTFNCMVVDVQGAELEVLESFSQLDHIKCMMIEVSVKEYYKGQAVYADLKIYLEKKGFIVEDLKTLHGDIFCYKEGYKSYKDFNMYGRPPYTL